jgi:hypothetical protein
MSEVSLYREPPQKELGWSSLHHFDFFAESSTRDSIYLNNRVKYLNPQPQLETLNPKPSTPNPQPQPLNPQPSTLNLE